jgi:hypothetical protein
MKGNKELISYLEHGVSMGHTKHFLKSHLMKEGFRASAIDEAFNHIDKKKSMKVPGGLKFIIGFQYFLFVALIAVGIFGWISLANQIASADFKVPQGTGIYGVFIFLFFAGFSLIPFFSARGLRKRDDTWKIVTIVFAALTFIQALILLLISLFFTVASNAADGFLPLLIGYIVLLGITAYHIVYLGFVDSMKVWFKK